MTAHKNDDGLITVRETTPFAGTPIPPKPVSLYTEDELMALLGMVRATSAETVVAEDGERPLTVWVKIRAINAMTVLEDGPTLLMVGERYYRVQESPKELARATVAVSSFVKKSKEERLKTRASSAS